MFDSKIYYFDNNATTQIAPEVAEAINSVSGEWGNPSSAYGIGRRAAGLIKEAREKVAGLINAKPQEIIFTSCGTESINSAIHSAITVHPNKRHIVTTSVEHYATLNYCKFLERSGYSVTYLPVDQKGRLNLKQLEDAICEDTAIVSVMLANNETGVLFPIEEISAICRSRGVLIHTDAVQAIGKIPVDVRKLNVDLLSISAHKLHAPKGVGALYIRSGVKYAPYIIGGHQEGGRRAGTENTAFIVGFGKAAELAAEHLDVEQTLVKRLRDKLENEILSTISGTHLNGDVEMRLPNTSNISFDRVDAEALLIELDRVGVCASSASACTTGSIEPSHVLMAMRLGAERARRSIRFSLSRYNTEEEVDYLLKVLPGIVNRLRQASPQDIH